MNAHRRAASRFSGDADPARFTSDRSVGDILSAVRERYAEQPPSWYLAAGFRQTKKERRLMQDTWTGLADDGRSRRLEVAAASPNGASTACSTTWIK